jgi:hypothetical protein
MAEERNVAMARAPEATATAGDADATKEELQRRMEEARESISQTVTEIKETVVSQYQNVRESINDTLDWREQYRRHTVPLTLGAAGAGVLLGYCVAAAVVGRGDDDDDYEEEADYAPDGTLLSAASPAYAAQPVIGSVTPAPRASASRRGGAREYAAAEAEYAPQYSTGDVGPDTRPAYAGADESQSLAAEPYEPEKPSLLSRFKETKAYDRLQEEVSTLGDRVVDELSKTAQTVILPAILGKLKDMIGIDLGTQREVAKRSQLEHQTAKASAAAHAAADSADDDNPRGGGSGL